MTLARPITLSRSAWGALRDGLIEPARSRATADELLAVTRLAAAWGAGRADGPEVAVFLTPEDAATLAALLDAHPELAPLLGG